MQTTRRHARAERGGLNGTLVHEERARRSTKLSHFYLSQRYALRTPQSESIHIGLELHYVWHKHIYV